MTRIARYFPWLVVALAGAYLVSRALPAAETERFHFQELASIPVSENGRVKPLDTVARNTLMILSKRRYFTDAEKRSQPAIRWLMDAMTGKADQHEVFRIEDDQLLRLLDLKAKPLSYRYSSAEISPKFAALQEQANQALALPEGERDAFNVNVLRLYKQLEIYVGFVVMDPPGSLLVAPRSENEEWQHLPGATAQVKGGGNPAVGALYRLLTA
jgi:hypothetical protein